jgi:cell division protein FtsQ
LAISIPHRAERTRTRSSRPRRATAILCLAGAVVAVAGLALAVRSSLFDARSIVVTGASHLRPQAVVATAGVDRRTNVPMLDETAIERRLLAEPWIATADVSVSLPWTIDIEITERSPVAAVVDSGRSLLLADDGTVLGDGSLRGVPTILLPTVAATDGARPSAAGAAAVIGAMDDELRGRVNRVIVASDGTLDLRLDDGVVVEYGSPTLARRKAIVLERILRWSGSGGGSLARIALAAPDVPAVTLAT